MALKLRRQLACLDSPYTPGLRTLQLFQLNGEVPERPNGPDSKSGDPSRGPRVQIPPSPPSPLAYGSAAVCYCSPERLFYGELESSLLSALCMWVASAWIDLQRDCLLGHGAVKET